MDLSDITALGPLLTKVCSDGDTKGYVVNSLLVLDQLGMYLTSLSAFCNSNLGYVPVNLGKAYFYSQPKSCLGLDEVNSLTYYVVVELSVIYV